MTERRQPYHVKKSYSVHFTDDWFFNVEAQMLAKSVEIDLEDSDGEAWAQELTLEQLRSMGQQILEICDAITADPDFREVKEEITND